MSTFLHILPVFILPSHRCHATWGSNDCHPCCSGEVDWFGVEQGDGPTGPGTERLWITIPRANSLFAKKFARGNYSSPSKCGKRVASLAQDCNAHGFVWKKNGAFNTHSQQPLYFISLPCMLPHAIFRNFIRWPWGQVIYQPFLRSKVWLLFSLFLWRAISQKRKRGKRKLGCSLVIALFQMKVIWSFYNSTRNYMSFVCWC